VCCPLLWTLASKRFHRTYTIRFPAASAEKLAVTYGLKVGSDKTITVGDGGVGGTSSAGFVEFPEGIYLSKLEAVEGRFVDCLKIHRSDGTIFKYGYKCDNGSNKVLSKEKSVINLVSRGRRDNRNCFADRFDSQLFVFVNELASFSASFLNTRSVTKPA